MSGRKTWLPLMTPRGSRREYAASFQPVQTWYFQARYGVVHQDIGATKSFMHQGFQFLQLVNATDICFLRHDAGRAIGCRLPKGVR